MDIDRVRYFHVFAETGSLVSASSILHISQPALSKALKLLESETGIKLVIASGRGLKLTPEGIRFIKKTSSLLSTWLDIPKTIKEEISPSAVKIGSFEVFTTYFLEPLSKVIDLQGMELHDIAPGKLERAIADGGLDFGITYLPIPNPGVEFIEMTKIRMGIFGSLKFKESSPNNFPFVVPLSPLTGSPSRVVGLDGWPDHKVQRTIKFKVTLMESALQLCRQGLAVAYLPSFIPRLHNQNVIQRCKLIELSNPVPVKERLQSVYLIQRKGEVEGSVLRQIAKCLRTLS